MNLNQVTVPSQDVERSIIFYQNLGLKLIVKSLPNYARFQCPDGTSSFSIHHRNELSIGEGVYVYFECQNIDKKVEELKQLGIQFELEPTDQSWLWREARLKDLDGNQLILFYAGDNRLNPPWRIEEAE